MNISPNELISLFVSVVSAVITLSYLWKTRVIGADKELTAKYKDGYLEYKDKYKEALKKINEQDLQLDMMKVRLAKAEATIANYEGQPYRPHNASLHTEEAHELNQTV